MLIKSLLICCSINLICLFGFVDLFAAPIISIQKFDSTINVLTQKIDSVKNENVVLNKKITSFTFTAKQVYPLSKEKQLYHFVCLGVIVLLSFSIMFLTAYVLFKKMVTHKYSFIDF